MRRLSREVEDQLVESLEQVTDLVDDGLTPDQAICRVATEQDLPIGCTQLLIQAYNTGRTNAQRKQASSLLDKLRQFPIANAAAVLRTLYPDQLEDVRASQARHAVSDDYDRPPESQPAAKEAAAGELADAASGADPSAVAVRMRQILELAGAAAAERSRLVGAARDRMSKAAAVLASRLGPATSPSFADVRDAAAVVHGERAARQLDEIAARHGIPKHAARPRLGPIDWGRSPYCLAVQFLEAAEAYRRTRDDAERFLKCARVIVGCLDSELRTTLRDRPSLLGGMRKTAVNITQSSSLWPALAAFAILRHGVQSPSEDDVSETSIKSIAGPGHSARLLNLRRGFMLHRMLAHDPVIKGYAPAEVLEAYNELANLSPRLASQDAAVRAILRRYLAQGQLDVHDIEQMAQAENLLKQRDAPTERAAV